MKSLWVFTQRITLGFCLLPMTAASAQEADNKALQDALYQWDLRQAMLEVVERCPVLEPHLRWGIAAQMDALTQEGSEIAIAIGQESAAQGFESRVDQQAYLNEVLIERARGVQSYFASKPCDDTEVQKLGSQGVQVAKYGFYERLYVMTRLPGGYCMEGERREFYGAALREELASIAIAVPETSGIKARVDAMADEEVALYCSGVSTRYSSDPFVRSALSDFELVVDQRQSQYPLELILPLIPTGEGAGVMAWRAQEGLTTAKVAAGLLSSGICTEPLSRRSRNGENFLGLEEEIDVYFGMAPDGNLIVQLSSPVALQIQEIYLERAGQVNVLEADREETPIAVSATAQERLNGGGLKRFVFEKIKLEQAGFSQQNVSVTFEGAFRSRGVTRYTTGCTYDLGLIAQGFQWATGDGIGSPIY